MWCKVKLWSIGPQTLLACQTMGTNLQHPCGVMLPAEILALTRECASTNTAGRAENGPKILYDPYAMNVDMVQGDIIVFFRFQFGWPSYWRCVETTQGLNMKHTRMVLMYPLW